MAMAGTSGSRDGSGTGEQVKSGKLFDRVS